jgi:hypothetical protein
MVKLTFEIDGLRHPLTFSNVYSMAEDSLDNRKIHLSAGIINRANV